MISTGFEPKESTRPTDSVMQKGNGFFGEQAAILSGAPPASSRVCKSYVSTEKIDCSFNKSQLPHDRRFFWGAKRAMDIAGSVIGILLSVPWVALAAVLIWWEDRGPVFFIQERVGKDGQKFRCFKLRTMSVNADSMKQELMSENVHQDARTFKHENDPRITKVGRWLRRWSIDEFPQFLNVLFGQMSLVGPRPAVPAEVELYSMEDRVRLLVKPGLTCYWQISGRSSLPFSAQIQLDAKYIRETNIKTELAIILKTFPALISCKGAR